MIYRPKLITSTLALDCEMVQVEGGKRLLGTPALGRCSIINYNAQVILDVYVIPRERIISLKTKYSGITSTSMQTALPFDVAQSLIANILRGKIVVAHAAENDFGCLKITPTCEIRDTSKSPELRRHANTRHPLNQPIALKKLSKALFGTDIQMGMHCSVADARATLALYKLVEST